jgi:hypothetical protein
MANKASFLKILAIFYTAIVYTIFKVCVRLQLTNVVSKVKPVMDKTFIRVFNSNHPKRLFYALRVCGYPETWLPQYLKPQSVCDCAVDEGFVARSAMVPIPDGLSAIYLGDSHVEYLSRVKNTQYAELFSGRISLWLGPKTLLGLYYGQSKDQWLGPVINHLDGLQGAAIVFFSIGSIDIRASFYELLVRRTVANEEELFLLFRNALIYFFEDIVANVADLAKVKDVAVFEIFPCTLGGVEPTSSKEIKMIRKSEEYPVFGSVTQRMAWVNAANMILEEVADVYDVHVLPTGSLTDLTKIEAISLDGVHISCPSLIGETNNAARSIIEK